MRALKGILFILLVIVFAAGCSVKAPGTSSNAGDTGNQSGGGAKSTATGAASSGGDTVTLKLGGIEYPYTKAEIQAFEKKYPKIKIDWNPGNNNFEDGSVQALLRSGKGPDIMVVSSGPGRVGMLSNAGLIRPIDDVMKKYDIASRYQQFVIDQTRTQGKGKIYELVEGVDVFQVYYNKDIFKKYGLQVPKTWDEFLGICKKLKSNKVQPIVAGFRGGIGGGWMLGNLVEAAAGKDRMTKIIYGDGKFDQKQVILGGEMLKQLVDNGYVNGKDALAIDQSQAQAAFLNGKGTMNISPQGMISGARQKGTDVSKFDSFLLPSRESGRPARPSAGLAHSWIVNVNTKKMPAVEKWLDWVSSKEYLKIASQNGAVLVPVVKVPKDIKLDPAIQDAAQKLENGAGYNPSVYLPAKAKDAWYAAVDAIVTGSKTPEQAMKAIDVEMEKARAKNK